MTACTRREFLAGSSAVVASMANGARYPEEPFSSLGHWFDDENGLPAYAYAGPLRFPSSPREDGAPMLPDDPLFLLGNYRLTLFTHASGLFQLISGEGAWARLNAGIKGPGGANQAAVSVGSENHNLIGLEEPAAKSAQKSFGIGFARYVYTVGRDLEITRKISVMPSSAPGEGFSAFLVQVQFRHRGESPFQIRYTETMRAHYDQICAGNDYSSEVSYSAAQAILQPGSASIGFVAHPRRQLTLPGPGEMSRFDSSPPSLFVRTLDAEATAITTVDAEGFACLGTKFAAVLHPGTSRDLAFVFGYVRDGDAHTIDTLTAALQRAASSGDARASAFGNLWRRVLPEFAEETDLSLRREMRWNVAVLEAMATWREYYDETVIPQGTMYDYVRGVMASNRDIAQQALPLCHTNPHLARSTLRWIMKRMVADGEIKFNDEGFGWSPSGPQLTSDQQLYFFLLLAEYLRVTRDASILNETIEFYPRHLSGRDTGLAHVRLAFLYLRDRIGVGAHGIVKRWNSDWNDMFFYWPTTKPYNRMFQQGESHMNSTMAIVILGDLAAAIDGVESGAAKVLTEAMRQYRKQLLAAWTKDLGTRSFSLRAWTDPATPLGDTDMWLEPQSYALLIPELSLERKQRLFAEVERRLLKSEAMGARQIETPVVEPGIPQGARENGGFWYALHGPLVLGVASFDKPAAHGLLHRMTFANFSRHYPDYWTGQWSASDCLDSSLLRTAGLSSAMIYCAHPHAWPLYCYLRLRSL